MVLLLYWYSLLPASANQTGLHTQSCLGTNKINQSRFFPDIPLTSKTSSMTATLFFHVCWCHCHCSLNTFETTLSGLARISNNQNNATLEYSKHTNSKTFPQTHPSWPRTHVPKHTYNISTGTKNLNLMGDRSVWISNTCDFITTNGSIVWGHKIIVESCPG